MGKERSGSIVKRKACRKGEKPSWWARITYTDPVTGKRHDPQRRAESKAQAKDLVHDLLSQVDSTGGQPLANETVTFDQLAKYFKTHSLKPAECAEGRTLAGFRRAPPPNPAL